VPDVPSHRHDASHRPLERAESILPWIEAPSDKLLSTEGHLATVISVVPRPSQGEDEKFPSFRKLSPVIRAWSPRQNLYDHSISSLEILRTRERVCTINNSNIFSMQGSRNRRATQDSPWNSGTIDLSQDKQSQRTQHPSTRAKGFPTTQVSADKLYLRLLSLSEAMLIEIELSIPRPGPQLYDG
jgi:hypothetical protein